MKKFIQNNFTVIVLVIALLTLFKSCGVSCKISGTSRSSYNIKREYEFYEFIKGLSEEDKRSQLKNFLP